MKTKESKQNARYLVFTVLVMLAFAYLVFGLFNLQIVKGDEYAVTAGNEGIKTIAIRGVRGMITDIDSVPLAKSETIYNVTFQRTLSDKDYTTMTRSILETIGIIEKYERELCISFPIERDAQTGEWVFNFGSGITEAAWNVRHTQWRSNHFLTEKKYPTAEDCLNRLRETYKIDTVAPDISEEMMLKVLAVYSEMQMNIFNALPIVIAKDVPFSAVSEIEGRSMVLFGMSIAIGEKRVYPQSSLASNILGYVGKIQSSTQYYNELKPLGYAMNDTIGLDGIEKTMENWLTANITERQGYRIMESDSVGNLTREIEYLAPTDGNTVKLTINAAAQRQAERAIAANVDDARNKQEKKLVDSKWLETNKAKLDYRDWEKYQLELAQVGVLMVIEAKTGKVIALAQTPTYDLNAMVAGGAPALEIIADKRNILLNYAIQTRGEPGSIFKMVTGLAALTGTKADGTPILSVNETISDGGKFKVYTKSDLDAPTCWTNYPSQHANLDIVGGLSKSCNFFFYTIASRMYSEDTEMLYKYAAKLGLTSKTGIELPGELRSVVGSATNLYDPAVSLKEQVTDTPIIVANAIKRHLINFGASYGIEYETARLDRAIKQLMDMAIVTGSDDWVVNARPILMNELYMTREMVMQRALMSDMWVYLNTIAWGGSQSIQMAIGQSITLLTPAAVSRYVAAIANGGYVYDLMIVDSIISPDGEIVSQRSSRLFNKLENVEQFMPYILEGMEGVVDESGTAESYFRGWKYRKEIRAKTGTSQVTIGGIKLDVENNSWFVSMAPYDDPEIVVICYIPHGMSGGYSSMAARDFIEWYLDEKGKVVENIDLPSGNMLTP